MQPKLLKSIKQDDISRLENVRVRAQRLAAEASLLWIGNPVLPVGLTATCDESSSRSSRRQAAKGYPLNIRTHKGIA